MPTFNKKNQLWIDSRTLEEEEERWFDQEDEVDDGETLVPMNDVLKSKLDSDFDQINRFMENRKGQIDWLANDSVMTNVSRCKVLMYANNIVICI